jgi:hypothetical protein
MEMSAAAAAVGALLNATRKRSRTVQWMPLDELGPERYEVIVVSSGDVEQVVSIDAVDGAVYDDAETAARLRKPSARAGA